MQYLFILHYYYFVGLAYVMSAKRAKLTGIHHFFKPAGEATSAAVDCFKLSKIV